MIGIFVRLDPLSVTADIRKDKEAMVVRRVPLLTKENSHPVPSDMK